MYKKKQLAKAVDNNTLSLSSNKRKVLWRYELPYFPSFILAFPSVLFEVFKVLGRLL